MKILIITETFLPSTDGVVTRLTQSICYLRKNKHEVVVIAPDLGVYEYEGAVIEGVKATTLPFYRYRPFSLPQTKVKEIIEKHQPDLIHVVNPAILGASGVYYAEKLGYPLIASYHTHVPKYFDYYHLKLLKPLCWSYFRKLHNKADLNLCTSEAVQKELLNKNFFNVHVWQRGVDVNKYHPDHYSSEMRERLSKGNKDKKLLLFVGRLAAEKEIHKLHPLLKERDDIHLAIVGDGPERDSLEEIFLDTNTTFTGFLHGQELASAFASADAMVFPSTTETLGLVILESMASGLPVIAAKSEPTMEQIEEGKTGILYENEDVRSMNLAIEQLYNKNLFNQMKINARNEAERYSWARPSRQLIDFYEMTLSLNDASVVMDHG
ncbi:glycosyltransferase family 4 protein [Aquibacillus albus]|uniref:Glycosyltransferase involved in cell wall biosynthesis n=1 Tax=Aquibacillus albus TaxID=1168171 RepID=A0ABS2MVH3_9BACI|nr:glycosyltransferase family 1 protein [Aquibacillus albus]MBM7569901.1 glycosyltransferase involved in cell wall biosynthesis [Aquibacillus albus]